MISAWARACEPTSEARPLMASRTDCGDRATTELPRSGARPHGFFFFWRDSSVMTCVGRSVRRRPDHIGGAGFGRKKGAFGRKRARFEGVSVADLLRKQRFRALGPF
jgi:hypothetical protein